MAKEVLGKLTSNPTFEGVPGPGFPRISTTRLSSRLQTTSDHFGSYRDLGVRSAPGIEDPFLPKISVDHRYLFLLIEILSRGIDGRRLRGAHVRSWWTSASHHVALHVPWPITGARMRRSSECPLRPWTRRGGRKRRTSENGPD